jgi:hypothetical protein
MNLRKGTNLELVLLRMRMVTCLQSHIVLNRWKNFFNQVLNVHGVHEVRQMEIPMAEPLMPEPSLVKVEIATGKLKSINPWVLIRFQPLSNILLTRLTPYCQ